MVDHILKADPLLHRFNGNPLDPREDRQLSIEPVDGGVNFVVRDRGGRPLANAWLDHNKAKWICGHLAELLGGKVTGGNHR